MYFSLNSDGLSLMVPTGWSPWLSNSTSSSSICPLSDELSSSLPLPVLASAFTDAGAVDDIFVLDDDDDDDEEVLLPPPVPVPAAVTLEILPDWSALACDIKRKISIVNAL